MSSKKNTFTFFYVNGTAETKLSFSYLWIASKDIVKNINPTLDWKRSAAYADYTLVHYN